MERQEVGRGGSKQHHSMITHSCKHKRIHFPHMYVHTHTHTPLYMPTVTLLSPSQPYIPSHTHQLSHTHIQKEPREPIFLYEPGSSHFMGGADSQEQGGGMGMRGGRGRGGQSGGFRGGRGRGGRGVSSINVLV